MGTPKERSEVLQGTLDLMVLKTLDAIGPQHGYGIARRIKQISEDALQVNQGTIYLCLIRLVQRHRPGHFPGDVRDSHWSCVDGWLSSGSACLADRPDGRSSS